MTSLKNILKSIDVSVKLSKKESMPMLTSIETYTVESVPTWAKQLPVVDNRVGYTTYSKKEINTLLKKVNEFCLNKDIPICVKANETSLTAIQKTANDDLMFFQLAYRTKEYLGMLNDAFLKAFLKEIEYKEIATINSVVNILDIDSMSMKDFDISIKCDAVTKKVESILIGEKQVVMVELKNDNMDLFKAVFIKIIELGYSL